MNKELIYEYESVLIGQKRGLSDSLFQYQDPISNEHLALSLIKYALNTYLHWDAETLQTMLTMEVFEKLKLTELLKYIVFPPEINEDRLSYLVGLIYPRQSRYDSYISIVRTYVNVRNGTFKKYPKEFFTDSLGTQRARVCLLYYLEHYTSYGSPEELYAAFADEEILNTLGKNKLRAVCKDLYLTPLDYLHDSLPEEQKSELLYRYHIFNTEMKRTGTE